MSRKSVFVLGDSISIHYGPSLEKMLAGVFNYDRKSGEELALKDLNNPMGANGGDSSMVLDFLKEQYENGKMKYDILLLNCGLHDIKTDPATKERQVRMDKYRQNLSEVLELVKKAGVSVVWVRTTHVIDEIHNSRNKNFQRYIKDLDAYNDTADGVMKENGVPVIDLYSFTKNLGEDVFADHVHFKEEIRALQAAFIAGHLYGMSQRVSYNK